MRSAHDLADVPDGEAFCSSVVGVNRHLMCGATCLVVMGKGVCFQEAGRSQQMDRAFGSEVLFPSLVFTHLPSIFYHTLLYFLTHLH